MRYPPFALVLGTLVVVNATIAAQPETSSSGEPKGAESRAGSFLTLPIFITEPAIGEGLGASLIYFHRNDVQHQPRASTGREISRTGRHSKPPPTATGIFGFYTNDDSAAIGIGHSNTFLDDTYRLVAAGAEARINSQLYLLDQPFGFTLEGELSFARVKRRLGRDGAFAGVSLSYLDAETTFRTGIPELDNLKLFDTGFTDAGLALSLIYDTRDNTILPAQGFLTDLTFWSYSDRIGGDFDYHKQTFKGLYFVPFARHYVLGMRVDLSRASGEVPFYAAPYVKLRGIAALRYQGRVAGALEIEIRRQLDERWAASAFTGAGYVDSGFNFGETEDEIRSIGLGLRYLALREQDAWVGIDVARGPEDTAWYVQMGSSW